MADLREAIIRAVLMQSQVPTAIAQSPMGRSAAITVNPGQLNQGNTPDMNAPDRATQNLTARYPEVPPQYSQYMQPQNQMSVRGMDEGGQMQTVPGPQMSPSYAADQQGQQDAAKATSDRRKSAFWEFLKAAGVPLGAGLLSAVAPGTLPAMAGLSTGYAEGYGKAQDRNLEREKINYSKDLDKQKLDQDKLDDSYKIATDLLKTGAFGAIDPTTPDQLAEKANLVYQIKYGSATPQQKGTDTAAKEVKEKAGLSGGSGKFKSGETRTINGVNFQRDEKGNWNQVQ